MPEIHCVKFKIVGIGEVLWDLLPAGKQLGGAPANFGYHAGALGADAYVVSRVGNDALGRELLDQLVKVGLPTGCIEVDPVLPTGTVSVAVSPDGQPTFQIHENVAWDRITGGPIAREAVSGANAVCYGTLAQRSEHSRTTIRELVKSARSTALRILDVNLRQNYYSKPLIEESLTLANVLKLNDTELPRLAEMFGLPGDDRAQIVGLAERFGLAVVALTRGAEGSLLYREGEWSKHPSIPAEVVDTVGAGDAFTAAMTIGLLSAWPLAEINQRCNELAAFVCSRAGAMPPIPESLK